MIDIQAQPNHEQIRRLRGPRQIPDLLYMPTWGRSAWKGPESSPGDVQSLGTAITSAVGSNDHGEQAGFQIFGIYPPDQVPRCRQKALFQNNKRPGDKSGETDGKRTSGKRVKKRGQAKSPKRKKTSKTSNLLSFEQAGTDRKYPRKMAVNTIPTSVRTASRKRLLRPAGCRRWPPPKALRFGDVCLYSAQRKRPCWR